jgi:hypothetical protein
MSGNDAFDRAVKALRETADTSPADVARTRMRVLETLHRGERRGRRTFWVLLPIAAVLAGGAAFAKDSDVVRRVWTGVAEAVGVVAPAETSPVPVRPMKGQSAEASSGAVAEGVTEVLPPAAPEETAPRVEIPPPSREPTVGEAPPLAPRRARRSEGAERVTSKAPPPSETVEPEASGAAGVAANDAEAASLQLYKGAYRLHFVEQRYAEALTAWDAYLRAAPAGRLVVEARYNRAIALVRLGRRGEAETALAPFARGEVSGGYRAREAQDLLDVLNASSR